MWIIFSKCIQSHVKTCWHLFSSGCEGEYFDANHQCLSNDQAREGSSRCVCINYWWENFNICIRRWFEASILEFSSWLFICNMLSCLSQAESPGTVLFSYLLICFGSRTLYCSFYRLIDFSSFLIILCFCLILILLLQEIIMNYKNNPRIWPRYQIKPQAFKLVTIWTIYQSLFM